MIKVQTLLDIIRFSTNFLNSRGRGILLFLILTTKHLLRQRFLRLFLKVKLFCHKLIVMMFINYLLDITADHLHTVIFSIFLPYIYPMQIVLRFAIIISSCAGARSNLKSFKFTFSNKIWTQFPSMRSS
ncbi:hypothetical protein RF11_15617 [Thelohanellus kitauei]|uniref:Uncharacterized protein n=1 Tax=Thelohanellus kitauei TaxID=669202 RepID=A0A0C2NC59_THEKT|nr:hypothetical protein RF11_15617 [Thelohanellus kitauei]